jgi:lipoprotein-releasing system permease protein
MFSRLELAQNLLELNSNEYSSIALKTKSKISKEELSEAFSHIFKLPIKLVSRAEQNAALYKMLNVERIVIYFIFTLVMLVALFNFVGALIMMILDKKSQMKTLLSFGATAQGIHYVFFILGLLICGFGGIVGLIIGSILVLIQNYYPFIYVPGTSLSYPVLFQMENLFIVMGTLMVLGVVSTAWATRGFDKKIKS